MNWINEIDNVTDGIKQNFGHLNNEQLNWQPNSNTWSVAQNLEHLMLVNETYYPILTALKEEKYRAPYIAKIGFMVSFFGKTVLQAVDPNRRKKMKTFPIWEPHPGKVSMDVLSRFESHQNELKQKIKGAKELIERGVVIASPANKNIVYKLETAFDIIVKHEQRHSEQAKEVLLLLKK